MNWKWFFIGVAASVVLNLFTGTYGAANALAQSAAGLEAAPE